MSSPNHLDARPDPTRLFDDSWVEHNQIDRTLTRLGAIFQVTEDEEDMPEAVLTQGSQLPHLDRLYYESADF